jgi:hypothetical protein
MKQKITSQPIESKPRQNGFRFKTAALLVAGALSIAPLACNKSNDNTQKPDMELIAASRDLRSEAFVLPTYAKNNLTAWTTHFARVTLEAIQTNDNTTQSNFGLAARSKDFAKMIALRALYGVPLSESEKKQAEEVVANLKGANHRDVAVGKREDALTDLVDRYKAGVNGQGVASQASLVHAEIASFFLNNETDRSKLVSLINDVLENQIPNDKMGIGLEALQNAIGAWCVQYALSNPGTKGSLTKPLLEELEQGGFSSSASKVRGTTALQIMTESFGTGNPIDYRCDIHLQTPLPKQPNVNLPV